MTADPQSLREELDRLRQEGLQRLDAWDAEKRESKRLRGMMERFRAQADELRLQLDALTETHEAALQRIEGLEATASAQRDRIDRLAAALEKFGVHGRGCKFNPKKADSVCSCGMLEAFV